MSAVRTLPALMTSKVALAMLFARLSRLWFAKVVNIVIFTAAAIDTNPRCLNIIVEDKIIAAGLARLVPIMS